MPSVSASAAPTDDEVAALNDHIILAGKRIIRTYIAELAVERYQDLKHIHDIIDECWHQNESIRGRSMGGVDTLGEIITAIRLCDTMT